MRIGGVIDLTQSLQQPLYSRIRVAQCEGVGRGHAFVFL